MSSTVLEAAITNSRKLRPRSKELYLQHVHAFLAFAGTSRWAPWLVIAWRDDMQRRDISPQSVNVALNALRYAAKRAGLTFFTPDIERLPVPPVAANSKAGRKADRALSWAEGQQLLATCAGTDIKDIRDRAIIVLGLRTGMLRFSMCRLTFDDVDVKSRPNTLTFEKKGGDRHTIPLDPSTAAALYAWMKWLITAGHSGGAIFRGLTRARVTARGQPIGDKLTPDGLYRALAVRAREAELTDISPHVFRKTFIGWALDAGAQPGQIEAVTGHQLEEIDGLVVKKPPVTTPPANFLIPSFKLKD